MENFTSEFSGNKVLMHPNFYSTLEALSDEKIFLPSTGKESTFSDNFFVHGSGKVSQLEKSEVVSMNIENGSASHSNYNFAAYDESWVRFEAIEGSAFFTTHSLCLMTNEEYIPLVYATFNFYTRSTLMTEKTNLIKFAENIDLERQRDYIREKVNFLLENTPSNSVLFVDGPLIAGDLYTILLDSNTEFLKKNILVIYFVKNSSSNLITDNIEDLKGRYNSDMHWALQKIKPGQRSSFFSYEDQHQSKNKKVFCYFRYGYGSPQRIEMHSDTFKHFHHDIENIMDCSFYFMCVQGDKANPQLRLIAIAEKYARAVLRTVDINKYFREAKLTPTINEIRFA